ncbi:beige/beach-related [Anaeramoeba flamelloides]|uniref:Beige/beach-related n=1 Tax=Anaeramoeba flamelloides TaxID=1746091 RepID=A0ABQ8YU10_9EUKA|nr:beige/beach-related [Anaeramoeba flamelloides]
MSLFKPTTTDNSNNTSKLDRIYDRSITDEFHPFTGNLKTIWDKLNEKDEEMDLYSFFKLLYKFYQLFLSKHKNWVSSKQVESLNSIDPNQWNYFVKKKKLLPKRLLSHTAKALIQFKKVLSKINHSINDPEITEKFENNSLNDSDISIGICLKVCKILILSKHHKQILFELGFLDLLGAITQTAVMIFTALIKRLKKRSKLIKTNEPNEINLTNLETYCLIIIQYLSVEISIVVYDFYGLLHSKKSQNNLPIDAYLLELLSDFLNLFRKMKKYFVFSKGLYESQKQLVKVLKFALSGSTQLSSYTVRNCLNVFIKLLDEPNFGKFKLKLDQSKEIYKIFAKINVSKIQIQGDGTLFQEEISNHLEFQSILIILDLFKEFIINNPNFENEFFLKSNLTQLTNFIAWCAYTFSSKYSLNNNNKEHEKLKKHENFLDNKKEDENKEKERHKVNKDQNFEKENLIEKKENLAVEDKSKNENISNKKKNEKKEEQNEKKEEDQIQTKKKLKFFNLYMDNSNICLIFENNIYNGSDNANKNHLKKMTKKPQKIIDSLDINPILEELFESILDISNISYKNYEILKNEKKIKKNLNSPKKKKKKKKNSTVDNTNNTNIKKEVKNFNIQTTLAYKLILNSLNVFSKIKNVKYQKHFKENCPELQVYILNYLLNLPDQLIFSFDFQIWKILFSSFFLYKLNSKTNYKFSAYSLQIYPILENNIFDFLKYSAIIKRTNNFNEIKVLLKFIKFKTPILALKALKTFKIILKNNFKITMNSFTSFNCLLQILKTLNQFLNQSLLSSTQNVTSFLYNTIKKKNLQIRKIDYFNEFFLIMDLLVENDFMKIYLFENNYYMKFLIFLILTKGFREFCFNQFKKIILNMKIEKNNKIHSNFFYYLSKLIDFKRKKIKNDYNRNKNIFTLHTINDKENNDNDNNNNDNNNNNNNNDNNNDNNNNNNDNDNNTNDNTNTNDNDNNDNNNDKNKNKTSNRQKIDQDNNKKQIENENTNLIIIIDFLIDTLKINRKLIQFFIKKSNLLISIINLLKLKKINLNLILKILDFLTQFFYSNTSKEKIFNTISKKFIKNFQKLILSQNYNIINNNINLIFENLKLLVINGLDHNSKKIKLPQALLPIFEILLIKEENLFTNFFQLLSPLIIHSSYNKTVCCSIGMISFLFKRIFRRKKASNELLSIVKSLVSHSFDTKELKTIFKILISDLPKKENDHSCCLSILLLLQHLIDNTIENKPKFMFEFNGDTSFIQLPKFTLSLKNGFSFCTWINFNKSKNENENITNGNDNNTNNKPNRNGNARIIIFEFINENEKYYFQLYIEKKYLMCKLNLNKKQYILKGNRIVKHRWTFIAFSSNYSKIYNNYQNEFFSSDNGFRKSDYYKTNTNDITFIQNSIGKSSLSNNNQNQNYSYFQGKMGAIHIFNRSLSQQNILEIYNLGPQTLFLDNYSKQIIFSLNSKTTNKNNCINNSLIYNFNFYQIIYLIFKSLIYQKSYRDDFLEFKGFNILSILLQKNNKLISLKIISLFQYIFDQHLEIRFSTSMINELLFDFEIWYCTDYNIQKKLFELFINIINQKKKELNEKKFNKFLDLIKFQRILIGFMMYYFPNTNNNNNGNNNDNNQENNNNNRNDNGNNEKTKILLTNEEISNLRSKLIELIELIINYTNSLQYLNIILGYCLLLDHEKKNLMDLLLMIKKICKLQNLFQITNISKLKLIKNIINSLLILLQSSNQKIRLISLEILTKIGFKKNNYLSIETNNQYRNKKDNKGNTGMNEKQSDQYYDIELKSAILYEILNMIEYSESIFQILYNFFINKKNKLINYSFIFLTYLRFLKRFPEQSGLVFLTKLKVLKSNPINYEIINNHFGWQYQFFNSLILNNFNYKFNVIILKKLTNVNYYFLTKKKNGYKIFKDTLNFLDLFLDHNNSIVNITNKNKIKLKIQKIIISFLFNLIQKNILQIIKNTKNKLTIKNFIKLINLNLGNYFLDNFYQLIIELHHLLNYYHFNNVKEDNDNINNNNSSSSSSSNNNNNRKITNNDINNSNININIQINEIKLKKIEKKFFIIIMNKLFNILKKIKFFDNKNTYYSQNQTKLLYNSLIPLILNLIIFEKKNGERYFNLLTEMMDISCKLFNSIQFSELLKDILSHLFYAIKNNNPNRGKYKGFIRKLINNHRHTLSILPIIINKSDFFINSINNKELFNQFKTKKWQLFFKDNFFRYQMNQQEIFRSNHKLTIKKKKNYFLKIKNIFWFQNNSQLELNNFNLNIKKKIIKKQIEFRNQIIFTKLNKSSKSNKIWKLILQDLTNERAPFGDPNQKIYWKLDKTEDSFRRRLKLKRNYKFDPHFFNNASIKRDLKNQKKNNSLNNSHPNSHSNTNINSNTPNNLKIQFNQLLNINESTNESNNGNLREQYLKLLQKKMVKSKAKKNIIYQTDCILIKPTKQLDCVFQITTQKIKCCFKLNSELNFKKQDKVWKLKKIKEIYKRKYKYRKTSLEFFSIDQTNLFLNFPNIEEREKVYKLILQQKPKYLRIIDTGNPSERFKNTNCLKEWQHRKISNFEYLMKLNTIAGRTINDASQYPVFPWVLKDYTSKKLDLKDPKIFRNFSKPIGIQNSVSENETKTRYKLLKSVQTNIPPFHYGSHYSTPGSTSFYLIRLEPFSSLTIKLQDNAFDKPDRLFVSLENCWKNSLNFSFNVSELIPEFFYLPELFENVNNLNLGIKQNGKMVNHVLLPPWAKGSKYEFIRIHREALESEYVSEHLHEWIDLIFGYKQRGEEAVKATNVFYYLTYEGMVNFDQIKNEEERKMYELQIESFGQCPSQLIFNEPHPKRLTLKELMIKDTNWKKIKTIKFVVDLSKQSLIFLNMIESQEKIRQLFNAPNLVISIDRNREIGVHKWLPEGRDFQIDESFKIKNKQSIPMVHFDYEYNSNTFNYSNYFTILNDGKTLISCGFFDSNFRLINLKNTNQTKTINFHKNVVTCLKYDYNGNILVTGSLDSTICIWKVSFKKKTEKNPFLKSNQFNNNFNNSDSNHNMNNEGTNSQNFDEENNNKKKNNKLKKVFPKIIYKNICYGHHYGITCLDLSVDLDIIVSASKDKTFLIHNINNGRLLQSISLSQQNQSKKIDSNKNNKNNNKNNNLFSSNNNKYPTLIKISNNGEILIYCEPQLYLYTINGSFIKLIKIKKKINSFDFTHDHKYFFIVGESGLFQIHKLSNLELINNLSFDNTTINSVFLTTKDSQILLGMDNGQSVVVEIN